MLSKNSSQLKIHFHRSHFGDDFHFHYVELSEATTSYFDKFSQLLPMYYLHLTVCLDFLVEWS